MRTTSVRLLMPSLLVLSLLLISLWLGALACSSEDEGRMWQPAESESEERRETEESVEDDEDEADDAGIEDRKSDEEKSPEKQEDEDEEEERTDPVPTPIQEVDSEIADRPGGIGRRRESFSDDVLALIPASDDLRDITAFDVKGIRTTEGVPSALEAELQGSYGFLEAPPTAFA